VNLLRWDPPGPYAAAFSTRAGGVSNGPYASLNLGRLTADDPRRVEENRGRLCAALSVDPARLAMNLQVHGVAVHRAQPGLRDGPGDGLWTDAPGVPLLVLAADCLPIVLVRTGGVPAVAAIHAGWRGLLAGIVEAGVAALGTGCAAAVGPGIGACCYEVGAEVSAPYAVRFGRAVLRRGRLDLRRSAVLALQRAGVDRIEHFDACTACGPTYFSHRRDGPDTGRQGVLACVA
jgi:YfiH family protein